MALLLLRKKAIALRLKGYTYSQIKRELGVQKSTLSDWLRMLSLTEEQLNKLAENKERAEDIRRERYRITRQKQRLMRLQHIYSIQEKEVTPLSKRELFLMGLLLYWGEGEKSHGVISISNSDPKIIKFAFYWMVECLKIPKSKIKIQLHIYKDMNIKESINFWVKKIGVRKDQFKKPYIKKTNREGLTYKSFDHGTCKLYFWNVELSEKIAMSIKVISDTYGAKNDVFWYN